MRKLRDIRLGFSHKSKIIYGNDGGVLMLYCNYFTQVDANFSWVILYLTDIAAEVGNKEEQQSYLSYYFYFNMASYKEMPNDYNKKKFFLDFIQTCLLQLCDLYHWDKQPFEVAYQKCLENNLQCDWFFKGKLFQSPNKQHYMGLFHSIDFDGYEVYEVLFDKNKQEITRRKCFYDSGCTFSVTWASWEKGNDIFYYKFSNISKVFEAKVTELFNQIPIDLPNPMNTSKFFKK